MREPLSPATVRRRLILAVALPFLCMALLTALLLWQAHHLLAVQLWVDQTDQVIAQAQLTEKILIEMQNGMRGYVITRRPDMLDAYNDGEKSMGQALSRLQTLVADNPTQSVRVIELTKRAQEWRDYAQEVLPEIQAGKEMHERVLKGEGKQRMDAVSAKVDEIIETESGVRAQRTATIRLTTRIIIGTSVATMLTLGVILALFSMTQLVTVGRTYAHALQTVTNHANALKQSEERFRLMVDGVTDYAMFLLDPHGNIVSWNRGAQRITDYRSDDVIGKPLAIFFPPDPDATAQAIGAIKAAEASDRFEETGWRMRQDRSKFFAYTLITALRDDAGRLRGFSHLMRDLTERKDVEDALRQSRDEIRRLKATLAQQTT